MDIPEEIRLKLQDTAPEVISYIQSLHQIIESMEARIKELESRLNLNSNNSGKPPSSDGYARKNRKTSLREKTQKNLADNQVIRAKPLSRVRIQIM